MIAALYCRKSTDQTGVSDEQRSVTRQIEHGKAYAARKGWRVLDEHVYVDDGISGAEFARRRGLQRLRAALKPRPSFEILIVSEQSRLSRDTADTLQVLKELARAGVRVFAYQDDRPISLETPADTLFTTVNAWKDSEARREAAVRTHEALVRKARAACVAGGRVFGYRNVDVFKGMDAHGRQVRSHVTREVHEEEAAAVRRVFELCAAGYGVRRTAGLLNEAGVRSPRPQQDRRAGWAASSVRAVLYRELYRGVVLWNRTRKRNGFGQRHLNKRDRSEWVRLEVPELQIVSDALWEAAHARLTAARKVYLAGTQNNPWGRPPSGTVAKYLLTGIGRCGVCGGGFTTTSGRAAAGGRWHRYVCATRRNRGVAMCANALAVPVEAVETMLLTAIESDVLQPRIVERAVARALDELRDGGDAAVTRRATLAGALAREETQLARLARAVAEGGNLSTLLEAIRNGEQQRDRLREELRALDATAGARVAGTRKSIERWLRQALGDWRGLMHESGGEARRIVELLLDDRLVLTPDTDDTGAPVYRVQGRIAYGRILAGILRSQRMASPAGLEPATPGLGNRCSILLSYGDERVRTPKRTWCPHGGVSFGSVGVELEHPA